MARLTFRLSDDLRDQIKWKAVGEGVDEGEIVRRAIADYLAPKRMTEIDEKLNEILQFVRGDSVKPL